MKILDKEDPQLHEKCNDVTSKEIKSLAFQKIIDEMSDIVYQRSNKGKNRNLNKPMTVGLSANQIGIMKRISIVDLAIGSKKNHDIHILINPKILYKGKRRIQKHEGCVNLPEIWGRVERYSHIKVSALTRFGIPIELDLKGWPAVLLQHEIDHLNGYLFIDRLENPKQAHFVTDNLMKKYRKLNKEWNLFIDVTELLKNN